MMSVETQLKKVVIPMEGDGILREYDALAILQNNEQDIRNLGNAVEFRIGQAVTGINRIFWHALFHESLTQSDRKWSVGLGINDITEFLKDRFSIGTIEPYPEPARQRLLKRMTLGMAAVLVDCAFPIKFEMHQMERPLPVHSSARIFRLETFR